MTKFTIETTYHLPVYRQRTYEALSIAEACRRAVEDDDWDDAKKDYESSGATYVSGAWEGAGSAYRGPVSPVPGHFEDANQRKADHFEPMLGMLKILAHTDDPQAPDLPAWLPRARAVIAKAEAILAERADPDPYAAGALGVAYVVRELAIPRVREQIVSVLETDPDLAPISAGAVTDADIYDACVVVVAAMNLAEEIGAAEFRAARIAIGKADRRMASCFEGGPDHA